MPLYLPPQHRRPDPERLRTDDRRVILVGTGVWALLLVVTLLLRDDLRDDGRGWWPWTCAAGVGLGLIGLLYLHRRAGRPRD